MQPLIETNKLSKKYHVQKNEDYLALRDVINGGIKNMFTFSKKGKEDFWALKDIDINIGEGERIGIIGRNGAGKSTLLKILSRITTPTSGEAIIRGKLASLLEVGTGFHPELTGRENIYLNGSILGLKKREIDQQFDEIVDFSGVSKFLDMPLKNYSSGMQLRLAFAVAAHLKAEILLIDEVLAVGDLEFQKKCLGKMEEVSTKQGRTILFVSHNMQYISSLCNSAILLEHGRVTDMGKCNDVIFNYTKKIANLNVDTNPLHHGNKVVRLLALQTINSTFEVQNAFLVNETIGIQMKYEVLQENHILWLGYNIYNEAGINVFDTHSVHTPHYTQPHEKGIFSAVAWIPANLLNIGNYFIGCAIFNHKENIIYFHEEQILMFAVNETFTEKTARGSSGGDFPGVIRPLLEWTINKA